jgi:hypothetical protein
MILKEIEDAVFYDNKEKKREIKNSCKETVL